MKIAYALLTTCLVLGGQTPSNHENSAPIDDSISSACSSSISNCKMFLGVSSYTQESTHTIIGLDSSEIQTTTGRVVAISNDEYSRLQKLRQALNDAETKIAKDHGVYIAPPISCPPSCTTTGVPTRDSDHYEFRGRYLLINVPAAE
jgi:hypothetical protein